MLRFYRKTNRIKNEQKPFLIITCFILAIATFFLVTRTLRLFPRREFSKSTSQNIKEIQTATRKKSGSSQKSVLVSSKRITLKQAYAKILPIANGWAPDAKLILVSSEEVIKKQIHIQSDGKSDYWRFVFTSETLHNDRDFQYKDGKVVPGTESEKANYVMGLPVAPFSGEKILDSPAIIKIAMKSSGYPPGGLKIAYSKLTKTVKAFVDYFPPERKGMALLVVVDAETGKILKK